MRDPLEVFVYALVRALIDGRATPVRHATARKRRVPKTGPAGVPDASPVPQSPVPEFAPDIPAPPFTQAQFDRMEAVLRGEAPAGYYRPGEATGAGDGVS